MIWVALGYGHVKAQCSGTTDCCHKEDADCICIRDSDGQEIDGGCLPGQGGLACGVDGHCSCTLWCDATDTRTVNCYESGGNCVDTCNAKSVASRISIMG